MRDLRGGAPRSARGRVAIIAAVLSVLLVVVPPLIRPLFRSVPRSLQGAHLDELQFQEVSFRNDEAGLSLAGLLFVPQGKGPFPAAVIIHGSGTSQRENGWYLTLVRYMQSHGIVVLLPDKRGSVASEGDWRTASFEDLAADALAAMEFMREQQDVAVSRIGLIGMSQGGWIAPIAASMSADVAFVVNVVGAAVSAHEQLLYEENHNLRHLGFLPGISNALAHLSSAHIRRVAQREFWQAIGDFDPMPFWRRVTVPTLVLYGREDTNVPSIESAERLRASGNPQLRVEVYEGSGHALEDPEGRGSAIFREDALAEIRSFIERSTLQTGTGRTGEGEAPPRS